MRSTERYRSITAEIYREAQKAYERLRTPLEKYTARREELNKALKDGKILRQITTPLMAAAKRIMKRR